MTVASEAVRRSPRTIGLGRGFALLLFWAVALVAGFVLYQRYTTPAPIAVKGQRVAVQRGTIAATVNTTGSVVAGTTAKLTFKTAGRLAELNVRVGDTVKAGQVLAKVDQSDLQLQVTQAKASLASAEAKLAQIQVGSRPEEVASAQSALASAQAKLALLRAGPTGADIQSAQAAVANAKTNLVAAQAKLADLQSRPKPEDVRAAQLDLEKAKNSLWSTQLDRDGTCGNPRNADYVCNSANARVASAETGVTSAQLGLAKASLPASADDLGSAQESLTSAQTSYNSALAKLDQVKAGATAADIAAAQSSVDSAASQLALKKVPYTDADVQSAKASVEQAKVTVALNENSLANAALLAPFAGSVSAVAMNPGEIAGGSSAITLVDPKDLRIDATVDESDVAKLEVGQAADISFDSLSGRRFDGKVIALAPSGTVQSGVVTYLVSMSISDPSGLKPGMTANANIVYLERNSVLMVPNRAVRAQGRFRVVEVAGESGSQIRQVQVGVANDQFTEITEGLSEGEEVIIATTSTAAPRVGNMGGPPQGMGGGPGGGGNVMVFQR